MENESDADTSCDAIGKWHGNHREQGRETFAYIAPIDIPTEITRKPTKMRAGAERANKEGLLQREVS